MTGLLDISEKMVFDLRNLIILHKAFLRGVVVPSRELVDFIDTGKGHGTQFRTEIKIVLVIPIIERLDTDGVPCQHEIITVK